MFSPQQGRGVGWWDGYSGQHTVIIDEFYGQLRWSFVLQLLDRYPLRVETKGGCVPFVSRRIIITSNREPSQWYKSSIDPAPLLRRLTAVHAFPLSEKPAWVFFAPGENTA